MEIGPWYKQTGINGQLTLGFESKVPKVEAVQSQPEADPPSAELLHATFNPPSTSSPATGRDGGGKGRGLEQLERLERLELSRFLRPRNAQPLHFRQERRALQTQAAAAPFAPPITHCVCSCCRSRSLSPGRCTSSTRQLGTSGRLLARKPWAEANVWTPNPAERTRLSRASRIDGSSSRIKTVAPCPLMVQTFYLLIDHRRGRENRLSLKLGKVVGCCASRPLFSGHQITRVTHQSPLREINTKDNTKRKPQIEQKTKKLVKIAKTKT
jgi:hypothetical protein